MCLNVILNVIKGMKGPLGIHCSLASLIPNSQSCPEFSVFSKWPIVISSAASFRRILTLFISSKYNVSKKRIVNASFKLF